MKVLFLRSNPVAPDPRVEKAARALQARGFQVEVLAWDRTARLPTEEKRWGVTFHRIPLASGYARGVGNLPALLRWQWSLLWWLVRNRKQFDVIHACDFDTVLPALIVRFLFAKRVVYDIFDFYADHLRATPAWITRVIRWVDLKVISWVDAVILVDEKRREQIRGSRPRRLAVIYNSPEDFWGRLDCPERADPSDEEVALRLVYVGLLQVERGLLDLLEVLARHPEWHLDLAGFGGDQEEILARAKDLPNVKWHGRVSYQENLCLASRADVFVALYDPNIPNHRFASPNKVFEAMMLSKPVIVARNTNVDRVVEQHQCGLVVEYGNSPMIEEALTRLAADQDLRRRLGENARKAYERSFGWPIMQERPWRLYEDFVER